MWCYYWRPVASSGPVMLPLGSQRGRQMEVLPSTLCVTCPGPLSVSWEMPLAFTEAAGCEMDSGQDESLLEISGLGALVLLGLGALRKIGCSEEKESS